VNKREAKCTLLIVRHLLLFSSLLELKKFETYRFAEAGLFLICS